MTMGLKPGDAVLLIERRDDREFVHNAIVQSLSMEEGISGTKGETAIVAAFVQVFDSRRPVVTLLVVHKSHEMFVDGTVGLAYEEMPFPPRGICRYCRCTENRACAGGCDWIDDEQTVCSDERCLRRHRDELSLQRAYDSLEELS